jgi:hypothetical protein
MGDACASGLKGVDVDGKVLDTLVFGTATFRFLKLTPI